MVTAVFDGLTFASSNGVEWLVQPVAENVVTTVIKFIDAFLLEVTNVEILYKSVESERQGTSQSLNRDSTTALPTL